MSKSAYQEKLEAKLQEWDAGMARIKARAKGLQADARIELESQLGALLQTREDVLLRLEELRRRGADAWEDLKDGIEGAWSELEKATKNIAARFQ